MKRRTPLARPGILLAVMLLATPLTTAQADWKEKLQGAVDATMEVGGKALDASKEIGGKALDSSMEMGGKALDATREMSHKALDKTRQTQEELSRGVTDLSRSPEDENAHFQEVWNSSLGKLEQALEQFDKIESAPESSWFGTDKKSARTDFEEILNDLIQILDDERIGSLRQEIHQRESRIKELQDDIRRYKEQKIAAPVSHMVETTRGQYEQKIKQSRQAITEERHEINGIKRRMLVALEQIGVHLTKDQLSVLLARVDSNDIIQMSAVFNVLKDMTSQLMQLTADSGEDLTAARRYYGMHLMLLETVVFMQTKYMDQIATIYIPGIDRIGDETRKLNADTRRQLHAETDANRKRLYQQNLHSQKVTLKATKLYLNNLKSQRNKVDKARQQAMKNRALARNTYRTVRISAEFLTLFKASQESFKAIINLQVPEIVPFENLEVQKKYEELSSRLGSGS
ncbi:MAG: hypothetical protein HQL53_00245 [Magnetococcales bacterium]|nr:hypothetical protein [Magnetococcales bacterium]